MAADMVAIQLQFQEMLKIYKASQTLTKPSETLDEVADLNIRLELQDTLRKAVSHISPINLTDYKPSAGQDPEENDLSKLELPKGADMHQSSEISQLENFLDDLEHLPHQLQQTFLNQLISRCVLRLEDHDSFDLAVFNLQRALGKDVHQDISSWLARLQGAVCRVAQMPLHPLLSSYNRRDLAQRTVQLLQRTLDNVKSPNDIRDQCTPIPPTLTQIANEQEQQLWDLGVGIESSVTKRAPDATHMPQNNVDRIIEKAGKHWCPVVNVSPVDTSQVYRLVLCRVSGLTPEGLNSLSVFIGETLKRFPILASTIDSAIAETLYLLWFVAENPCQYPGKTHDLAQSLLKILPDRLQHAHPREFTVVFVLGLRTSVQILGAASERPPALDPYVAFCNLMASSPSPDNKATLDGICLSMVAELRQLELVDLEQFAISHMDGIKADVGMSLLRFYSQYRLANPPVSHKETVRDLATRMAADSRRAHQGLPENAEEVGET